MSQHTTCLAGKTLLRICSEIIISAVRIIKIRFREGTPWLRRYVRCYETADLAGGGLWVAIEGNGTVHWGILCSQTGQRATLAKSDDSDFLSTA